MGKKQEKSRIFSAFCGFTKSTGGSGPCHFIPPWYGTGQNRLFLPLFWGRRSRLASMFTKSCGAQSIEHLRNCGASWGIASTRLLGQELQRFQIGREKIKRNAAFINIVFHIIPNFELDSEDVQDHEEKRFRTSKPKYNWLEGQYESLYGVWALLRMIRTFTRSTLTARPILKKASQYSIGSIERRKPRLKSL